ncbi:hypothetical protein NE237_031614 [Protea cynaroides]|uniref:Uncharacterized protein n=1 Tax=Protea cynaroides TaxID=273540 RepID=A0A9Q0L1R7_9MAGN|nr:hypothetical protein NE237_031614 [Protea cynaroides]
MILSSLLTTSTLKISSLKSELHVKNRGKETVEDGIVSELPLAHSFLLSLSDRDTLFSLPFWTHGTALCSPFGYDSSIDGRNLIFIGNSGEERKIFVGNSSE